MLFTAVISFFSYLFPTALSSGFISNLRLKYGESILVSIRCCERLAEKLQKAKCNVEFLRCCLIYNLMPNFINIRLWKPDKFCYASASRIHTKVMKTHQKILEELNRGPIGQNYEEMKLKLIHNISSYTLSKGFKADKGNCIVILNKEAYMGKAEDILKAKQFEPLRLIDNKFRYQLQSTCSSLSVFYGIPKAHKIGFPIRPTISDIGSYQYKLSKYLAKVIRDARLQAESYIKDSFEFVKRIKEIALDKQQKTCIMCSSDVESLYIKVPVDEAIETTLNYIFV
ncbi:unnamed protein product [Rotaria magnacalcarata]|uniref:Reverse transcriptase domain-containing protein n=4 Tax=Rotaria magnacalcarata TaxID=392030 RepID=A0A816TZ09_9BILA|nr:unnamed protein product [Rotaria magnacalcarata]CAF3793233.1 unnamed protein product [Rotaria magnacalcarata]CAF3826275.1 unnamed protein product [Rotaria magnacalcarata]CAF4042854.1 unnamed protein product [Rotaria magnacalcarata]